jgi:hypothetical protein
VKSQGTPGSICYPHPDLVAGPEACGATFRSLGCAVAQDFCWSYLRAIARVFMIIHDHWYHWNYPTIVMLMMINDHWISLIGGVFLSLPHSSGGTRSSSRVAPLRPEDLLFWWTCRYSSLLSGINWSDISLFFAGTMRYDEMFRTTDWTDLLMWFSFSSMRWSWWCVRCALEKTSESVWTLGLLDWIRSKEFGFFPCFSYTLCSQSSLVGLTKGPIIAIPGPSCTPHGPMASRTMWKSGGAHRTCVFFTDNSRHVDCQSEDKPGTPRVTKPKKCFWTVRL